MSCESAPAGNAGEEEEAAQSLLGTQAMGLNTVNDPRGQRDSAGIRSGREGSGFCAPVLFNVSALGNCPIRPTLVTALPRIVDYSPPT